MENMKNLEEKTLSSRKVYEGTFLKIFQDQALMPDGSHSLREYVMHPGASMMIPYCRQTNSIYMVHQYRYSMKQHYWELPAGKRDGDEDFLTTAQRELSEETGLKSNKWTHLISVHPAIGYTNEVIECFVAEELEQSEQHLDQGEFLQVQKIPVPHLLQMIQKGEMKDPKSVHALLYFANFYLSGSTKI